VKVVAENKNSETESEIASKTKKIVYQNAVSFVIRPRLNRKPKIVNASAINGCHIDRKGSQLPPKRLDSDSTENVQPRR